MPERFDEVVLILITSTILIVLLGTLIVVALLIQKKRQYKYRQQLNDIQNRYERTLLETKLKILEETFHAISQSLHDNIGSNISTAMLLLYKDETMEVAEQEANRKEALAMLDKIVDDLRNIAHSLNPAYLEDIGFTEAIQQRIEQLTKTKKYNLSLQHNEVPRKLNRQKQLILYYIFQEAINNIHTHAQARNISVQLQYEADQLVLQIKDDGKGIGNENNIQKHSTKGTGLMNMEKNAEVIGASLHVRSEIEKGTEITVVVPDPY